jgi:hypothetical protein
MDKEKMRRVSKAGALALALYELKQNVELAKNSAVVEDCLRFRERAYRAYFTVQAIRQTPAKLFAGNTRIDKRRLRRQQRRDRATQVSIITTRPELKALEYHQAAVIEAIEKSGFKVEINNGHR